MVIIGNAQSSGMITNNTFIIIQEDFFMPKNKFQDVIFTAIMTMQSALRSLPVRYWRSFPPLTGSRTLFTATTGKAP